MPESRYPWLGEDRHLTVYTGKSVRSVVQIDVLGPASNVDWIYLPLAPERKCGSRPDRGEVQFEPLAMARLVAWLGNARVQRHPLRPAGPEDQPRMADPSLSDYLKPALEDQGPTEVLGSVDRQGRRGATSGIRRRALSEHVQQCGEDDESQESENRAAKPYLVTAPLELKVPAP